MEEKKNPATAQPQPFAPSSAQNPAFAQNPSFVQNPAFAQNPVPTQAPAQIYNGQPVAYTNPAPQAYPNAYRQPYYRPAPVPKRKYTAAESVFAWLCFVLGYLFVRTFLHFSHPLGAFLFVILIYALTFVFVKFGKGHFSAPAVISAVSGIAVSAAIVVSGNENIRLFAFLYAAAAYIYFVYTAFGNKLEKGFSNLLPIDVFKAAFICPFASFGKIYGGLFPKGEKRGKGFLKVLLGVAIAFVPCVIIISLLLYDDSFRAMFDFVKRIDALTVFRNVFYAAFGVPVAMYIFGLFVSSEDKKCEKTLTAENCRNAGEKTKIAPVATVLAAVIPIALIYIIFFVSQWKYYVYGFIGALPDETSYAAYARNGFFQLTAVAFINFIIIALVGLLMKRDGKGAKAAKKAVSVVLSLMTLVLISTAAAKMVLYINKYGLTPKRVYASWAMCVLAILFILVIVRQFAEKLRLVTVSTLVVAVMFAGLALSDTDSLIARSNVRRYMDGSLETLDVGALIDCGDSAVPALVDYVKWHNETVGTDATKRPGVVYKISQYEIIPKQYLDLSQPYTASVQYLYSKADDYKCDNSFFSASLPRIRARKALENAGIVGNDFEEEQMKR